MCLWIEKVYGFRGINAIIFSMNLLFNRKVLALSILVLAVVSIFAVYDSSPTALAAKSSFIEKVGEGFMAPACGSSVGSEFICNGDGTVTARIHWYPEERLIQPACSDGFDNNDDGGIDYPDDYNCDSPQDASEDIIGFQVAQCIDGIDNDGDGLTDYPADPGCIGGPGREFESYDKPVCSDGRDNPVFDDFDGVWDYNGLIDYPQDRGCLSANDNTEGEPWYAAEDTTPECSDSIDNDGNTLTDYPADPGCASAIDQNEWNPLSWCKYVGFWDDNLNVHRGLGTPCYLGATEGFLWPPLPQNFTQKYRVYASDDPGTTVNNGNLLNEDYPPYGIVSFTTPSCVLPPLFNYSLSNSGTSNVTKTSGNAFTQNTITKALTSGTTESVTLSLSGVPGGISYSISNSACSPTCTSVITFTVSPSTPVGTHPITVTGSPLGKQTIFNLVVLGNPMTVSCSASPSPALLGQTVTWTAAVSGGTPPRTYSWSGTNFPTSPPPSTNPFSIIYSTIGQKVAAVTVTDTDSVTATCLAGVVQINFNPNLEEF